MTQITKTQHFVPKFYLKRFARNGKIQVLDVKAKRILKGYGYKSVCRERFFYAVESGVQDEISQVFEDVFGRIERLIANALPGIIERAVALQLTNDDLEVLAYFMSAQWLRTRFFRDRIQKMQSKLLKWTFRQQASRPGFQDYIRSTTEGREMSDKEIEEVKRYIQSGEYDLRFDNSQHLNFIDQERVNGFRNLLLAKKWRIVLSEEPCRFVTSDNPVAEWIPPMKGLFGPTFMDRLHLLALTPDILIETRRPDTTDPEQQPVDRLSYHAANEKGVLMFNRMLASLASQFAYGRRTEELEQLLVES